MADPLDAMRANMLAFYRLVGERARGAEVIERDGVVAAIVPSSPKQSVVNGVVYDELGALMAVRDELEDRYERAGVQAWRVWVPERDDAAACWLAERGHRLTVAPRAMTLDLAGAELGGGDGIECERSRDDAALAALNEQAYGLPAGEFAAAMDGFAGDPVELYIAYEGGEPAAGLAAVGQDSDCGIYCVATRPASRGRGLATGLLRRALRDARDRAMATSSLQSSDAGFRMYERIGYRDRGALEVWERRR